MNIEEIFNKEFNQPLVHQVVTAYLAGGRAGTKAQKSRGQVRGGGKKPWRQKGTGSARAGTIRSPLWRGGGMIFASSPRTYKQKVNRKMYRGALKSILSELVRQHRLQIVDECKLEVPKTKLFLNYLNNYVKGFTKEVLLVIGSLDFNLLASARNLPGVTVLMARELDPVSLVKSEKVLMTEEALQQIQGALA